MPELSGTEQTPPVPVEAAPAPAPIEPAAAPPVTEVVANPEPAAEELAAEPHHAETPSLLETLGIEPPKTEEPVNPENIIKPDGDKLLLEATLEPIVYEDFKFPETIKTDETTIGNYKGILSEYRIPQEAGQKLADLYSKAADDYRTHVSNEQNRVWADTRKGWRNQVMGDEQIGGSGYQTAMSDIADMRDKFVSRAKPGTEDYQKDVAAFNEFLRVTGAGDHPAFLKYIHNVARTFKEPSLPPPNPAPPPQNGRKPGQRGMVYDHPRSNLNGT